MKRWIRERPSCTGSATSSSRRRCRLRRIGWTWPASISASCEIRSRSRQERLQPGLVESHDHLTIDDDHRDRRPPGEAYELLPGLGAFEYVDVLVRDSLRRKELFRRAAGPSGRAGVDDNVSGAHCALRFRSGPWCRARMIIS